MEKVVVSIHRNEKGFYAKGEGIPFGIIDKNTSILLQEGEEWEAIITRKIIDKRGKEVPILRPVKKWENLPKSLKEDVEREIRKKEEEKEREAIESWKQMKENVDIQRLILEWKQKWSLRVEEKERILRKEICEIYEKLENIIKEIKNCEVVDYIVRSYKVPGCSSLTKCYYIFKFKDGREIVFERDEYLFVERDNEPNRLTGIGLGDWIDTLPKEIEALRKEYEKRDRLQRERDKLINKLEEKLNWLEIWESHDEKIRFVDTGKDLECYILEPWGSWVNPQSFRAWYVTNIIFEGE